MKIKSSKKTSTLRGCLMLMRPPNLPTAAADVIAGAAIVGIFTNFNFEHVNNVVLLVLSSVFLYAGGVVLNDVFDLKIDTKERPERPIPSGVVSLGAASFLGSGLLVLGILTSFSNNVQAGFVALCLAGTIILYDSLAKHHVVFGPLTMGSCRGLNLFLGMSIFGVPEDSLWYYVCIPVIYIAAVTLISRGEVHGDNKKNIVFSGALYAVVIFLILFLKSKTMHDWLQVLPFMLLFIIAIYRPLFKAYKINSPENIKKAVKAGVLSLVIMDATMAVSISKWWVGVMIILLLPLSLFLSKRFSVT